MNSVSAVLSQLWAVHRPDERCTVPIKPAWERQAEKTGTRQSLAPQGFSDGVPGVPSVPASKDDLPDEDWEERAAILEHEAGLDRAVAERQARRLQAPNAVHGRDGS